jgi:tetratricopeptide (TPR) repeat protein
VRPRISLCLIARDEEAMLPDCLASVRGAVDEVVLVDTGSRDRTAALARAAGARVLEWAWRDDFAAARNEALAGATGDWILQLDCDERLGPGAGAALRAEVRRKGPPFGLLPLHDAARLDAPPAEVIAGRARLGEPMWLPRLLRRLPDLRWDGVVHESVTAWLVAHGSVARRVAADIVHLGAVPELRAARGKGGRNLSLLERRCAGAPEDVAAAGYLAQEYLAAGRKAEARALCDRAWEALERGPRRLCLRLATARAILLLEAGEAEGALATVRRAAARDGAHPDLSWLAGRALLAQAAGAAACGTAKALCTEAAQAFRASRAARGQVLVDQSLRGTTGWRAALGLGEALLGLGDPAGAGEAFAEALAERPDLLEARLGAADALIEAGSAAEALAGLEPLLGEGPDAWALAAAAAAALGAAADARALLELSAGREGRGWVWARAQARARELGARLG